MPEFAADLIGRRIDVPYYDVPTAGGRPVEQIASKPDVWQHVAPRRGKGRYRCHDGRL